MMVLRKVRVEERREERKRKRERRILGDMGVLGM